MPTATETVNEITAASYSDNYTIYKLDGPEGEFMGCEHNETEAKAIAAYLTNYHGQAYGIRRNTPDQVRRAHELRGSKRPCLCSDSVRAEAFYVARIF